MDLLKSLLVSLVAIPKIFSVANNFIRHASSLPEN